MRPLAEPKSDNGNIYGKQHRRSKKEIRKEVGSNRTEIICKLEGKNRKLRKINYCVLPRDVIPRV